MNWNKCVLAVSLMVGAAAFSVPALAQDEYVNEPQPALSTSEFMAAIDDLGRAVRPPKFVSIQGIGSGTVAPGGLVFGSLSGTTQREGSGRDIDGSLSLGAGFGSADGGIGSQVTANITSVDPDDFGDSGYLSAKFGTRILPSYGNIYAGLGFAGLAPWGDSSDMDVRTTFAVTTFQEITPFQNGESYPLMLTSGINSHGRNGSDPAPFFGVGIGLSQYVSTSISHNGDYINAGLGVKLPWIEGASASLTVNDVFDEEDQQRVVFSVSFAASVF